MIEGRAVRLGDDVNTDNILPGAYLNLTDPAELAQHLLETYPGDVAARIRPGDIIVGGRNFGMGSSREQAQLAILGRGVQAIVAASFARIFLRNCVNVGLAVVESPHAAAAIADGDVVRLDLAAGRIESAGEEWEVAGQPAFVSEIVAAGGLVAWARQRLETGAVR